MAWRVGICHKEQVCLCLRICACKGSKRSHGILKVHLQLLSACVGSVGLEWKGSTVLCVVLVTMTNRRGISVISSTSAAETGSPAYSATYMGLKYHLEE